jgi:hypothetical protein
MVVDHNENPSEKCTVVRLWSSFEKIVKTDMGLWNVGVKLNAHNAFWCRIPL